jgi:SOS-response transcriptional repressor LexA
MPPSDTARDTEYLDRLRDYYVDAALKELDLEKGKFILKPHNPAYPIIRPQGQLEIFGVVTGLVRRYQH